MLKNKMLITLLLFSAPLSAADLELKNIFLSDDSLQYHLILQFNGTPEYLSSEIMNPPSVTVQLPGAHWDRGDFDKKLSAGSLYQYRLTLQKKTIGSGMVRLKLFFQTPPDYTITTSNDSSLVISWFKKVSPASAPEGPGSMSAFSKPVTLHFDSANLTDVIRLMMDDTGLNLVMGELMDAGQMNSQITLTLTDVPLNTALRTILNINGYEYYYADNIVVIKQIEASLEGELETRIYNLGFASGDMVQTVLAGVLTNKGSTIPFSTGGGAKAFNDRIEVTDKRYKFDEITRTIRELDQKIPQINIAVKFIETTLKKDETMGINWNLRASMSAPGGEYTDTDTSTITDGIVNFGKMFLGDKTLNAATLTPPVVSALLELLATDSDTKLLQEPQVTTFNNFPANIRVGTTIPVLVPQLESSVFGAIPYTYQNQNIDISMDVLPRINSDSLISLNVDAVVQAIVGYVGAEQRPIVSTRSTNTNVMVEDGGTLLMGGLIFTSDGETLNKVPLLGDLPLIKRFFSRKVIVEEQRELLIFITSSIVY
jgi:type II secretory pathway component GspD/PulD (secretin)